MAEQETVHYRATSMLTSKTMWLGAITILVGILSMPDVLAVIPLSWMPFITAVVGVLGMILRTLSVRPVAFIPPGTSVSVEVPKLPTANR